MSMRGLMRKAGIDSDGHNIDVYRGVLTARNIMAHGGTLYYCDPSNGDDNYTALSPEQAVATPSVAYDKMVENQNDTLVLLAGPTSGKITDQLIWAKDFCHLIGMGAPSWASNRARLFNSGNSTSGNALLKITAKGCMFDNFLVSQESAVAHCGAVEIASSAYGNYYSRLGIRGLMHATASAGVNSYSLFINGGMHSVFEQCTIGWTSIKRTGAATRQGQIIFDAGASWNKFINCDILNYSETAGHHLIKEADNASMAALNVFQDCTFYNFWENHGGTLTELFDTNVGATHDTLFINPALLGIDEIDASDAASCFVTGPATAAACGIAVTPTT